MNQSSKDSQYIYFYNTKENEEELCNLELRTLLGEVPRDNYFMTNDNLDISRSIYLRFKIEILYSSESLEELSEKMIEDKASYNQYKIYFIKTPNCIPFKERLAALRLIGFAIEGTYAMTHPLSEFALIQFEDKWYFGSYLRNEDPWQNRKHKPHNYSHAFDVKLAKTIINIAIGNNFDLKVVDPCCGIGTVVIEGKMLGVDITGYELNPIIAKHCNENLEHFELLGDIHNQDMHQITDHYDVAILDIPYGHFSKITVEEQISLICKARDIATKIILISMEEITPLIQANSLIIQERCAIIKTNAFRRYLYVCSK